MTINWVDRLSEKKRNPLENTYFYIQKKTSMENGGRVAKGRIIGQKIDVDPSQFASGPDWNLKKAESFFEKMGEIVDKSKFG